MTSQQSIISNVKTANVVVGPLPVKLDAVVPPLPERRLTMWKWGEDTAVMGSDTMFIYLKPR